MTELPQQDSAIGKISTASLLPVQLSQAQVAAQIYTSYFGSLPFARVAVTQQSACDYGQSWPMLVYLPICGFLDKTQQHFLGLRPEDMYWKVVTPHEVAHQWWGQTVGFQSYRDQWMSEGFADASASIFLQLTRPKPDDYLAFWKEQRKLITERNAFGFRPIDVGPVTMGYRLNSHQTGEDIARDLIYPKGAYILHMIRMMMWTPKEGDERFKATMHDLVDTYRLKAATTEDFKAIVEKHMSPQMDLDSNHKLDWFFNEYVYGTDLPAYHFEGDIAETATGTSLHYKLTQSGVSPSFKMLVPIYLEFADGKILRIGSVHITGPSTKEQTASLPKLPNKVKRVLINYNYDVLSTEN
jgi:aminopeptidase N